MKKYVAISLLCLLFSVVAGAQTPEEKAVGAAVENLRKAMIDADKAALTNLTAEELSYGHSGGNVEDKAAFIEAIASGASDFVTITLSDQTIKIADNVAIVRHRLSGDTNNGGKPGTVNLNVLLIWQKQKGTWKLLARQAAKIVTGQ